MENGHDKAGATAGDRAGVAPESFSPGEGQRSQSAQENAMRCSGTSQIDALFAPVWSALDIDTSYRVDLRNVHADLAVVGLASVTTSRYSATAHDRAILESARAWLDGDPSATAIEKNRTLRVEESPVAGGLDAPALRGLAGTWVGRAKHHARRADDVETPIELRRVDRGMQQVYAECASLLLRVLDGASSSGDALPTADSSDLLASLAGAVGEMLREPAARSVWERAGEVERALEPVRVRFQELAAQLEGARRGWTDAVDRSNELGAARDRLEARLGDLVGSRARLRDELARERTALGAALEKLAEAPAMATLEAIEGEPVGSIAIGLLERRVRELEEAREATLRENSRLKGHLDAARSVGAKLEQQLADAATVWIVGNAKFDRWEVIGAFRTEAEAVGACSDRADFVGPLRVGEVCPLESLLWPGAYYPVELRPAGAANMAAAEMIERENALRDTVPAISMFAGVNLLDHLRGQRAWSERTFGPGSRVAGVVEHIRKELREIEAAPADLEEWIDVALLAFDGAWRSGASPEAIVGALVGKQAKNERRIWPDWRTAAPDQPIEHVPPAHS